MQFGGFEEAGILLVGCNWVVLSSDRVGLGYPVDWWWWWWWLVLVRVWLSPVCVCGSHSHGRSALQTARLAVSRVV